MTIITLPYSRLKDIKVGHTPNLMRLCCSPQRCKQLKIFPNLSHAAGTCASGLSVAEPQDLIIDSVHQLLCTPQKQKRQKRTDAAPQPSLQPGSTATQMRFGSTAGEAFKSPSQSADHAAAWQRPPPQRWNSTARTTDEGSPDRQRSDLSAPHTAAHQAARANHNVSELVLPALMFTCTCHHFVWVPTVHKHVPQWAIPCFCSWQLCASSNVTARILYTATHPATKSSRCT